MHSKYKICPKDFCFNFRPAGTRYAEGCFDTLDDAINGCTKIATKDECGEASPCFRETKCLKDNDLYEPCEPHLERAGLSHYHFVRNPLRT